MNRAKWLMLGAGAVAIVRYVGVGLHAEGSTIQSPWWDAVNGASMAGMAILEAGGIWHCFESFAKVQTQPGRNRSLLMALIVAMFVSLLVMLTPYVFAASQRKATADVLVVSSSFGLWLWSLAVAAAPLLVMAAAGVADVLRVASVDAQEAQSETGEGEQVFRAMLANFEARINATMSNYVTVSDAQMAFDRLRQTKPVETVEPIETKATESETETAPLLVSGETWQAQAVALARKQTETEGKPNYTHIAAAVGKTRTAVAAVVKAQLS